MFTCFCMLGDLDEGGGMGGGKLVMRSLENRRHNGVMEGGSLSPSTPLHSLKRNKGAISIPYLMEGGLSEKLYSQIQTETKPPGGQWWFPSGVA